MHAGTEHETVFNLVALSEDRYSLLAPEGAAAEEVDWPTDEQCSAVAGVQLEVIDAGDHPKRAEAILRVVDQM
jgi:hypothetical protein